MVGNQGFETDHVILFCALLRLVFARNYFRISFFLYLLIRDYLYIFFFTTKSTIKVETFFALKNYRCFLKLENCPIVLSTFFVLIKNNYCAQTQSNE